MPNAEPEIEKILTAIHSALDVKIEMKADPSTQKIKAHFNVDDCLGKFVALMVYVGWVVPVNSMPNYNNVHANIEYWKQKFESVAPPVEETKKDETAG